ncbi:MAG: PAS domain-containing protein [Candidatus Pacebacteria bacterium]|nr:PAS domain-containing protein [Candidatus Paceibacterota bacterium]
MRKKIIHLYLFSVLLTFVIACLWEFYFEILIGPLIGRHEIESTEEKWKYILTSVIFVSLALIVPSFINFKSKIKQKESEESLKKSRDQVQAIIDNSTAIISLKDIKGKYLLINSRFEELFHITKKEIIGKTDFDVFPKDMAEAFQNNDRKVLGKGGPIEFEEDAPHDDGVHSYISIKFPLFDSSGSIYGICGISTDITERKQAEELLRQSELRLKNLVETSSDWVWETDEDMVYTYISPKISDSLGYGPEEILGKSVFDIMPPKEAKRIVPILKSVLDEKKAFILFENEKLHKDGHTVSCETRGTPYFEPDGSFRGYRGFVRDIGERKQAEVASKHFSKKLVESQELERKRIAAELHDSLAQNLMIIKNEIRNILKKFPEKTKDWESLNLASSLSSSSIHDIDRIVYNLRPSQLDHLGLAKAVRLMVENISNSSGVNICANINIDSVTILPEIEIHIYRIIQEGLNNIVKHSIASEGKIEIKNLTEHIDILISDDGKGFENNIKYRRSSDGFGLQGIGERAKICGGVLTIDSCPGKGSSLHIIIPLKGKEAINEYKSNYSRRS